MKYTKATRIIEDIFDIIRSEGKIKEEMQKKLDKEFGDSDIAVDLQNNCIEIMDSSGQRLLYKIQITKGDSL